MTPSIRSWLSALTLFWVFGGSFLCGQGFPDIVYELKEGSTLLDDCFCDRAPILVPIRGTMVLKRLPVRIVGELYSIKELSFQSLDPASGGEFEVTASGTYYRKASEPDRNSMTLDATVNGVSGIVIGTELVEARGKFPRIDIKIAENRGPARDPLHIYELQIVAEPVWEDVPYEVVEGSFEPFKGSFFFDDCDICGRPTIPLPITGSFVLRHHIQDAANPVQQFKVVDLALKTTREGFHYSITGDGSYTLGGEVAFLQSLRLDVSVNEEKGIVLDSGKVPVPEGVLFPEIQIHLEQENPSSPVHVFRMDLFARPSSALLTREFRRGDANADGTGDISDAVFVLLWRFQGGSNPPCLEAADINGDGQHDLADAVFLLLHLFQGGDEPPSPGLTSCGSVKQPVFGCDSYSCE